MLKSRSKQWNYFEHHQLFRIDMDIVRIVRVLEFHYERFYTEHNLSSQHNDVHMSMKHPLGS